MADCWGRCLRRGRGVYLAYADSRPAALPDEMRPAKSTWRATSWDAPRELRAHPCAFPGRAGFFVLRRRNARRAPAPPAMRRAEAVGLRISRAPHRFAALGDCCGDYSTFTDFDAGLPSSGLAIVTVRTPSLHSAFILSGSVPRGRVKLRLKAPYTRSEACRFSPF